MKKKSYIATWSGKKFDLINPRPADVDIRDIARGLSRIARFTGQTKDFLSVAQHCVHVMTVLREWGCRLEVQLYGLLHDAPEGYLNDVVRPLKRLLPGYRRLEKNMMAAILKGLKLESILCLSSDELKLVKLADDVLALTERRDQVHYDKRMPIKDFCSAKKAWRREIVGMEWYDAMPLFLKHYRMLRRSLGV